MTNKIVSAIVFLFLVHSVAQAQSARVDKLHGYCRVCINHEHFEDRPYNTKLKKEWPFLAASSTTLAAGLIVAATNTTKPYTEAELSNLNKNSVNSFDRPAIDNWSPSAASASDYMLIGATLLPVLFLAEHHTGNEIKSLVVISLEVFAFNYGLIGIVKNLTNRSRPYVYNETVDNSIRTNKQSKLSFYSGHTAHTAAATFLFAKVISDYHPDLKPQIKTAIWVFAATVPAIGAYLRVKGGRHYATDVIAGYAIGALSGFLIPELHRDLISKRGSKKTSVNIGMTPLQKGMVMNLSLRL